MPTDTIEAAPPLDTTPVTSTADAIINAMTSEGVDWQTGKKAPAKAEPAAAPAADTAKPEAAAKPAPPVNELDKELAALEAELPVAKPVTDVAKTEEEFLKDEPPAGSTPKTAESWKALKAKSNGEIARLKKELDAVKKQPAVDPELTKTLEALKKERDEFSQRLEQVSLERHPKFQSYFGAREKQALEDVKAIAGATHGEKLAALIALPDSKYKQEQLDDVIGELPESAKVQVGAAMVELRKLQREKEATLANAPASLNAFKQQEQEQQKQAQAKAEQVFDQIAKDAADKLPEWLQGEAGIPILNNAKALLLGNQDPAMLSRAAIYASLGPKVIDLNRKQQKLIGLYQQKIAQLTATEPGIEKSGSESTPPKEYSSMAEAVAAQAENNGFFQRR